MGWITAFRIFVTTAAPVAGVRIKREQTEDVHGGRTGPGWRAGEVDADAGGPGTGRTYRRLSGH